MTAITTAAPEFVWLEITGRCQLACSHCYADSGPTGTHGAMTTEDWRSVIDQAAGLDVRRVQFIGGEPTMHPDLADLIGYALSRALGVEVFTNLVHVPRPLWTVFAQPGVSLATSYYSDDEQEHNEVTGRPSYLRTKANIETALRIGVPIRVGIIELRDGQRVREARAELVGLGVPEDVIGYDRVRGIGRASQRPMVAAADQLCGRCGDGVAAVLPDGTVVPCVMSRAQRAGNVLAAPLTDAFDAMPSARAKLVSRGMPLRVVGGCRPGNDGGPCYPQNDYRPAEAGCRPGPCSPNDGADCYPAQD